MTLLDFFKTVHPSTLAAKIIFKHLQDIYPVLKISDIADTSSGGTPNRGMIEYYGGNIPWIKSGELKDSLITTCDEYITESGLKNSSTKLFPKGTLLVAMYGANIGKTGILDFDATTNQAVCAIFPKTNILSEYLFWYFKQQRIDFIAIGKGGAQPNISQTVINNAPIVVPNENVQKEIIGFLNSIDSDNGIPKDFIFPKVLKDIETIYNYKKNYISLIDSFKNQLTQLENLNQAILQEAVQGKLVSQDPNDEPASELLKRIKAEKAKLSKKEKSLLPIKPEEIPFVIPESWVWCRLGEICSKIGSGSTPKGSNYSENGIPFFRSQNIYNDNLVYEDITFISREVQSQMSGTIVEKCDILLNITGGSMGRCALVPDDFVEGNVSQHVCIIRPLLVDKNYFHKVILSPYFQKLIFSSTTGAGREGLPKYNLERFVIALPPLSEQKRIFSQIEKQFAKTKQLKEHVFANQQATEQLLKALLHDAFVVKDNSKEKILKPKVQEAKVVSIKSDLLENEKRNALAAEIVWQLHKESTFGHLKLQKIIYLSQKTASLDLQTNFLRQAMGPYDPVLMRSIDQELLEKEWFGYDRDAHPKYSPLKNVGQHKSDFNRYFHDKTSAIQRIIDLFRTSKSDHIEIVATLYACEEAMLNENIKITESLLLQRFYAWSEEKSKFEEKQVRKAYEWMRKVGLTNILTN